MSIKKLKEQVLKDGHRIQGKTIYVPHTYQQENQQIQLLKTKYKYAIQYEIT